MTIATPRRHRSPRRATSRPGSTPARTPSGRVGTTTATASTRRSTARAPRRPQELGPLLPQFIFHALDAEGEARDARVADVVDRIAERAPLGQRRGGRRRRGHGRALEARGLRAAGGAPIGDAPGATGAPTPARLRVTLAPRGDAPLTVRLGYPDTIGWFDGAAALARRRARPRVRRLARRAPARAVRGRSAGDRRGRHAGARRRSASGWRRGDRALGESRRPRAAALTRPHADHAYHRGEHAPSDGSRTPVPAPLREHRAARAGVSDPARSRRRAARCGQCGLCSASHMPTAEVLRAYYGRYYDPDGAGQTFMGLSASRATLRARWTRAGRRRRCA